MSDTVHLKRDAEDAALRALSAAIENACAQLKEFAANILKEDDTEGLMAPSTAIALLTLLCELNSEGMLVPNAMIEHLQIFRAKYREMRANQPCQCNACKAERSKPLTQRVPSAKLH